MEKTNFNCLLALWHISQLTDVTIKAILQNYPNLEEFFKLTHVQLQQIGFKEHVINQIKQPDWKKIETTLIWTEKPAQHLITFIDAAYPEQLRQIHAAPTILLARGNLEALQYSQLAIVGSRNPTHTGLKLAKQYAEFLARQGLVITSGLALGIDGMAHQGALSAAGKTIAVMGTGVDMIYPKRHQILAEDIAANGLLLSEFPLGTPPQALNFPKRNRIISGLSLGTFVVEASIRSGSLITARFALAQNREVFAMPSSIHNPMAKGCHWLIKQGATLIESVEDIWQQIQQQSKKLQKNQKVDCQPLDFTIKQPYVVNTLTKPQQQLLDVIGFGRMGVDALSHQTSLNIEQLSVVLLELELLGYIEAMPGGYQKTHESD